MAYDNSDKIHQELFYFYGDEGCDICNTYTGIVDSKDFLGHATCNCNTEPYNKYSSYVPGSDSREIVNTIYKNGEATTTGERTIVYDIAFRSNKNDETIDITINYNKHIDGGDYGMGLHDAANLGPYTFEKTISGSEDFTLNKDEYVQLTIYATLITLKITADVYDVYTDGSEKFLDNVSDEITVIGDHELYITGQN